MMKEKPCSKCLQILPADSFSVNPKGLLGRQSVCRKCIKLVYYLPNKERIMAYSRKRRAAPEVRKRELEWQRNNRRKNRLHRMLLEAKARAVKKGLEFSLKESDLVIPEFCPMLGIKIEQGVLHRADSSPSIERVDTLKGYVPGNAIVVSWRANRLKSDASIEEMEKIVTFCKNFHAQK